MNTQENGIYELLKLLEIVLEKSFPILPNYLVAVKYVETLKGIAEGQNNKLVFMPYESSALVNTVGTIKELLNPSTKMNPEN